MPSLLHAVNIFESRVMQRLLVLIIGVAVATSVAATPISVTIDTSLVRGTTAEIAFDLVGGAPPANSVTISAFAGDAVRGAATTTGTVTGSLATTLTLANATFFTEYLQPVTLGNLVSFAFDTTNVPPAANGSPTGFSVFLLDAAGIAPLVPTADPTGAGALLLFNLGSPLALETYSPLVTIRALPAPGSLALVLTAITALGASRRKRGHWHGGQ